MLEKTFRLRREPDFLKVWQLGQKVIEPPLAVRFLVNGSLVNSRFGFVAGKKIFAKATERNSVKRKLRETVRKQLKNIRPGYDVIVSVGQGFKQLSRLEVEGKIERLLRQARLL